MASTIVDGRIALVFLWFLVSVNCQAEEKSESRTDKGSCNVVNLNFGSSQPISGPRGPRGWKGEKGEKGDGAVLEEGLTQKIVSAMFKALAAHDCDELKNMHGMTDAGYYLLKLTERAAYRYCDFVIREGVSTCHQLREHLKEEMVEGYYQLTDWEGENAEAFYCTKFYTDTPTRCSNVDWREAKVLHKNGGVFNLFQYFDRDGGTMDVYCDTITDNKRWLVIQRRMDGSVDFYRDWSDYVEGFGDLDGEFWFGLEVLHRLTNGSDIVLRIDLTDWSGKTAYAEYEQFRVGSEDEDYAITFGSYSGTAGDSFSDSYGQPFSTKDMDNDNSDRINCAVQRHGAWWFDSCGFSNLNGRYRDEPGEDQAGIWWWAMSGGWNQLKSVEMKIREGWYHRRKDNIWRDWKDSVDA